MTINPRLHRIVSAQPYPLLFATISGAHLYGFPSPDSDFDLRGAHLLPLEKIFAANPPPAVTPAPKQHPGVAPKGKNFAP